MITRAVVVLLVSVSMTVPCWSWDREGFARDVAWVTGAAGADYLSTRAVLGSGGRELNPLAQGSLEGAKIATTALVVWTLWELRRRGHDRAAGWLRWTIVVASGLVTAWHISQVG